MHRLNRGGLYVADFRYDCGLRIRDSFISPTLTRSNRGTGEGMSSTVLIIEVTDESEECNEKGLP